MKLYIKKQKYHTVKEKVLKWVKRQKTVVLIGFQKDYRFLTSFFLNLRLTEVLPSIP
jgi:hypothetical protein